ncbi:MAG: amino acid ABC transporter ATP-binding protein [Deltaproteobacteria bacterium]|nr:amino acid ABC transporter ATP-binding protein [Deltaproteobacteria bacterium]
MVVLSIEALSKVKKDKQRGEKKVLNGIDLLVRAGEFAVLIGPSGGGKSTLLRLINRLEEPSSGSIFLSGKDLRDYHPVELRRKAALVMQKPFMFPGTALDNLQRPFAYAGVEFPGRDHPDIQGVLETCSLPTELVLQDARSLSIGQQQRVSLARSLLMAPDILLLDETISALDRPTAEKVAHALRGLCREKRLTVLMVTHDLPLAEKVASYGVYLEGGAVLEQGAVAGFFGAPQEEPLRKFLTQTSFD